MMTSGVMSGQTISGIILTGGQYLLVSSGGTVVSTTAGSGGIVDVLSGGLASFTRQPSP